MRHLEIFFIHFLLHSACYLQVRSDDFFQNGYEYHYSYYALIRTGSVIPNEAYSQWDIRALLTITSSKGNVIAQLTNLNTSLYNGPRDGIPEDLKPAPLPDNTEYLSTPFVIHYNGTNVEGISVDADDPLWAINMKRGIASIFQLDFRKFHTPASFISEKNIYGDCSGIEYSVVNNTEYVYIRKVIDTANCQNSADQEWSSATRFQCSGAAENPISASTMREYSLRRTAENSFELKHVRSTRRLYVQPFQAYGEAQQSYQYQVYQLLDTSPISESTVVPTNLIIKSLIYEQNMSDLTHGRLNQSYQQDLLNEINALLDIAVANLEVQNLDHDVTRIHKELMYIYYSFSRLTSYSLKTLYADFALGTSYQLETKRNIFFEILPQIGSENSVLFMKDLIVKRDLKDMISVKMLAMYPFSVKQHSEELLEKMEVLLTLGDNYEVKIRHAGILSFATLVYQTYMAGACKLETVEEYAIKYFNLFSESNSYEKRMLYLQGLDNLQLGSIIDYLTSIATNYEQSRHIRFLAALSSISLAPHNAEKVYAAYWPMFIDRSQHLEIRIAAFQMLFISQPTRSRLLTLFWYMQALNDAHLYNFFQTTLITLQNTRYPCYQHLGKLSSQILRFLKVPRHKQQWTTGNYLLDYLDLDRSFGGMIQLFLVGNPVTDSPNVIYLTVNNFATEKNLNQMSVYLKIQGVSDHFREMLNSAIVDMEHVDKLIKLLEEFNVNLISPEEIHVELIVKIQGKSVFVYYIDEKSFKKISKEMSSLKMLLEYHVNYQSIIVPYTREYMEASDLGTLVIRAIVSNSLASTRGNFLTRTTPDIHTHHVAIDFRYYTYTTSFLEIFNPISANWHGIEKCKQLQSRFLFNGSVSVNVKQSLIELTEIRNSDEYINVLLHTQSYTYLSSNGSKALQFHCPKCANIFNIHGDSSRETVNLVDIPLENFGNRFQLSVFDCENYQDIEKIFFDIYSSHLSNTQILPLAKPLMYILHLTDYITYIPSQGNCGLSVNLKPLYKVPTQLTISYKMPQYTNETILKDQNEMTTYLTLIQKKWPEGPNLQLWNATLTLTEHKVKRISNLSLVVEHKNSENDLQKLCLNMELCLPVTQADMFSLQPSNPTSAIFKAVWGQQNEETIASCPENVASIEANLTASVTNEQKELFSKSENWPYKDCKNSVIGRKFTPISLPCYLASKEAATYRKYATDIQFSNMPEWFISGAQKLQSFIGLFQTHSSQNDLIVSTQNSSKITNLKIQIEFKALEPKIALQWNSKDALIHYSGFEFIEKFLINTRFLIQDDVNINLGLYKVCLITPNRITTIDNRTLEREIDDEKITKKDRLLLADCSQFPKFAMFLDQTENLVDKLGFTLYIGSDSLNIQYKNNNIIVVVNNEEVGADSDEKYINVRRLQDDVILIKTKYGEFGLDIYYTREYIVVTIPGFYTGRICGTCSSIKKYLN